MAEFPLEIKRVGWIGTGIMGLPMCGHLVDRGYEVTLYNRTKRKAKPLLDGGAAWADSPGAVAERSDATFTIVGFPADVREVYFGENGVLAGVRAGGVLVDMTTTEPSLTREIHEAAKGKGVCAVDAPVSGGDVGARNASLSIMVGGDREAVDAVMPLLEAMGDKIVYQGGAGSGQHAKLCNQTVIAGTLIGICEGLIYGFKAGLDLETMLKSVGGGAAASWLLDNLAPRMIDRDFAPGFMAEHFIKDLQISLEESKRMGLRLPGLALAEALYRNVLELGHGRRGHQALLLALEKMSNVEIRAGS